MTGRLFTSESVTEGHPDKIADQISDSVLDEMIRQDPHSRVAVETLLTTGLVVVADMHYPGWTLTVDGRPAEILKTNRAMRGVSLPAGTHHLVFRYEPGSFRLGILLTLAGLAALATLTGWVLRKPTVPGAPATATDGGPDFLARREP